MSSGRSVAFRVSTLGNPYVSTPCKAAIQAMTGGSTVHIE
jgi:hypothetical protein